MYEMRLEINLDVIKRDIEPEQVKRIVETILKNHPHMQYIEVQTVKLADRGSKW